MQLFSFDVIYFRRWLGAFNRKFCGIRSICLVHPVGGYYRNGTSK